MSTAPYPQPDWTPSKDPTFIPYEDDEDDD